VKGSLAFSLNFLCDWTLCVCGCGGRRVRMLVYTAQRTMTITHCQRQSLWHKNTTQHRLEASQPRGAPTHITQNHFPPFPVHLGAPPSYLSGPMKRRGTPIFCISGNTLAKAMPPLVTTGVSSLL